MTLRDEFENLGELGSGGAGTVYAARHRASGREVAIKSLHTRVSADPVVRERFVRECRIQIESPHVVQVYEVRVEGDQAFLIMERVPGVSLEDHLEHCGALPIPTALGIAEQVALGLAGAHAQGVIHRDVKPGNILLTPDGTAKLGDFGIAKDLNTLESLTATGHGMGTLAYVSPEQAENAKSVDGRADLYSLGATLYHMIAGRPPFTASNSAELVVEIFEEEPPPLGAFRRDCPLPVVELVHELLEKDPDERPADAAGVVASLRALRGAG